jgi:hypothetical protein
MTLQKWIKNNEQIHGWNGIDIKNSIIQQKILTKSYKERNKKNLEKKLDVRVTQVKYVALN